MYGPATTSESPFSAARTSNLLAGTLVLIVLTLLAKLAHVMVPVLPGAVFALGFGVLAGSGSVGVRRSLPALPYQLPLTVGLILMGAQLDLNLVHVIGLEGLLAVAFVWLGVTAVFWLLAKTGWVPPRLAGLLTLGLIGCGVSAVVGAAQHDRKAAGIQTTYATLAILVSGAVALLVYPVAGRYFGLEAHEFGLLAGLTIANSAEAVATASIHSDEALGVAAGLKLVVNAVQGLPILVYLWFFTPKREHTHGVGVLRLIVSRVPYFVWGFAAVGVAAALGAFSPVERQQIGQLTRLAFFVALVGVGFQTRLDVVRRVGVRPVLIGTLVWAAAAGAVLLWLQSQNPANS